MRRVRIGIVHALHSAVREGRQSATLLMIAIDAILVARIVGSR
jgi:hypothetical protein